MGLVLWLGLGLGAYKTAQAARVEFSAPRGCGLQHILSSVLFDPAVLAWAGLNTKLSL